jgi:hypothetical protein
MSLGVPVQLPFYGGSFSPGQDWSAQRSLTMNTEPKKTTNPE